jgi:hypothetical protein
MKKNILLLMALLLSVPTMMQAQRRVVFITVDGYRWQELFGGADSVIINKKEFGSSKTLLDKYWRPTVEERRAALMPFVWNYVAKNGVIIGNRWKGCNMSVTNKMWFSYPGYNELLCGFADDEHINSNEAGPNPNVSVLEVANNSPKYKGKVLAFGSWDCFADILNENRSKLPVSCGYRHSLAPKPTERDKFVAKMQDETARYIGTERFDVFTHEYALEAMKTRHPLVLYVGYGDTDEWAHLGKYHLYLDMGHNTDQFIRELWEYAQSDPFYKNKTTFIVTCDHGRGDVNPNDWRGHGSGIAHADQTWLMAFGAGIPAKGELTTGEYHNNQIAPTVASLLGIKFAPEHEGAGTKIDF